MTTKFTEGKKSKEYILWSESQKFLSDSHNLALVSEVVELTIQSRQLDSKLTDARTELKKAMIDSECTKVYHSESGFMASLSQPHRNCSKKFDEKSFKERYPKLYEKFCVYSFSRSSGGILTIKIISDNIKKQISQFKSSSFNGNKR